MFADIYYTLFMSANSEFIIFHEQGPILVVESILQTPTIIMLCNGLNCPVVNGDCPVLLPLENLLIKPANVLGSKCYVQIFVFD